MKNVLTKVTWSTVSLREFKSVLCIELKVLSIPLSYETFTGRRIGSVTNTLLGRMQGIGLMFGTSLLLRSCLPGLCW